MVYGKSEVWEGAFLRMEMEKVFEGWVELISTEERELTSMVSEESPLIGHRRWLVRFLSVDECPELTPREHLTQINQKGRMCHRIIRRKIGSFSANYRKYPNPDSQDNIDPEHLLDNFIYESF